MSQDHKAFPAITEVALEMAYCNDGINRERTEEQFLEKLDAVLGAEGVYHDDLTAIEAWIAQRTKAEKSVLADGEETECILLMDTAPEHTEGLLNSIFEGAV